MDNNTAFCISGDHVNDATADDRTIKLQVQHLPSDYPADTSDFEEQMMIIADHETKYGEERISANEY